MCLLRQWCLLFPQLISPPQEDVPDIPGVYPACDVTRPMTKAGFEGVHSDNEEGGSSRSISMPEIPLSVPREELIKEQASDPTLKELFDRVMSKEDLKSVAQGYFLNDSMLVRRWVPHSGGLLGEPAYQVVVPVTFRDLVLKTSHDNIAGHLGVKKTYNQIMRHFYWPRLKRDVSAFIMKCHTCQLTSKPNQTLKPVPLSSIPAVSQPFEYLIIDCGTSASVQVWLSIFNYCHVPDY